MSVILIVKHMKINILLSSLVIILAIVVGFILNNMMDKSQQSQPVFRVLGDIRNVLTSDQLSDLDIHNIDYNDKSYKGFRLFDILEKAVPVEQNYSVIISASDGFTVTLDGDSLEESYIAMSDMGWQGINKNHPPAANVKDIKDIVVYIEEPSWDWGLSIISPTENILNITPGNMYSRKNQVSLLEKGQSIKNVDGKQYTATVYSREEILPFDSIVDISDIDTLLAVGHKGAYGIIETNGYFKMRGNTIDYVFNNGNDIFTDITGIMVNPPSVSIMDTFDDTMSFLNNNEDVLILFLDGFGYHQYLAATQNGYAPFISTLDKATMATSVFMSVTNAGFAAMITGEPPDINGVYSRAQRELNVPDMFYMAEQMGKSAVLIEGDIKILNTHIEPVLNFDSNGNGITDDEIFESAIDHMDRGYNLMMVHFHGIDDFGHEYGDMHERTMDMISLNDTYVKELVKRWNGKVIITSDHGMHSTDTGGNHGAFRYEDMIVPYIILDGGEIQ